MSFPRPAERACRSPQPHRERPSRLRWVPTAGSIASIKQGSSLTSNMPTMRHRGGQRSASRCRPARWQMQASRVKAGDVVRPQAAPLKAEFVAEVAARPGGRLDDQSDALAQMMANPPPTLRSTSLASPELYDELNGRSGGESDQYDSPWNKPSNETDDPWAPDLGATADPLSLNSIVTDVSARRLPALRRGGTRQPIGSPCAGCCLSLQL
jgi:hypothetical protein